MKSSLLVSRGALFPSLIAFAGCATTPDAKKDTASADEYVWVTPLGSNIPVRVRKGEQAPTASPTAAMSGDQAANAIHGGGSQMTPIKGAP